MIYDSLCGFLDGSVPIPEDPRALDVDMALTVTAHVDPWGYMDDDYVLYHPWSHDE